MHTHTYIYNAQEEAKIKKLCIPTRPEPKKVWHDLNRNQDVVGEHDE